MALLLPCLVVLRAVHTWPRAYTPLPSVRALLSRWLKSNTLIGIGIKRPEVLQMLMLTLILIRMSFQIGIDPCVVVVTPSWMQFSICVCRERLIQAVHVLMVDAVYWVVILDGS